MQLGSGQGGLSFIPTSRRRVGGRRGRRHWWTLRAWTRLIVARAARAAGLGIRYVQFIVPEKLSVYDHMTIDLPYDPARASTRRLARKLVWIGVEA
ncbi:hypothetical protein FV222_01220 [Methylobacterium sp. WL103]|nr:hypothetical protein FV222_01220 [Methylobacterium sp. WL103]